MSGFWLSHVFFLLWSISVIISPEREALKVALVGGCGLWPAAGPSRNRREKLNVMLISR